MSRYFKLLCGNENKGLPTLPHIKDTGGVMSYVYFALAACGVAGALIHSFPTYIRNISKTPPVEFALLTLGFSLFTGSVCALLFTNLIGHHWPWTIEPEPWPLALVVGLGSNPLVPILLGRIERWAEKLGEK
jgi:drug/metabolite transporter (DMT)-like permease